MTALFGSNTTPVNVADGDCEKARVAQNTSTENIKTRCNFFIFFYLFFGILLREVGVDCSLISRNCRDDLFIKKQFQRKGSRNARGAKDKFIADFNLLKHEITFANN